MALNQAEVAMIHEAMSIMETGVEKLKSVESNHPALISVLTLLSTTISFADKMLTMFEAV